MIQKLTTRLLPILGAVLITAAAPADTPPNAWLDTRISQNQREILNATLGFAPPEIHESTRFIDEDTWSFEEHRGKVVVIQSWTRESQAGRAAVKRVSLLLREFEDSGDVVLVGLHTPEGADGVDMYLERKPQPALTLVDTTGHLCDDLGIYKTPTSVVIDRQGAVRYVGLRYSGVREAVRALVDEPFDEAADKPEMIASRDDRDAAAAGDGNAPAATGNYPAIRGTISGATDLRGKQGPEVEVTDWINGEPDLDNKVIVVDFWATWCGPCRASIPHMNDLANAFEDEVVVLGLSAEPSSTLKGFMRRTTMEYTVASDPQRRMTSVVKNRGIPHGLVISPDGIVRWQGHPASLTEETLGQIVEASGAGSGSGSTRSGRRWVK